MKTLTQHTVVLSISEMEKVIEKMKENQKRNRYLSDEVNFRLAFDTDCNSHRICADAGYQYNSYAECDGACVNIE